MGVWYRMLPKCENLCFKSNLNLRKCYLFLSWRTHIVKLSVVFSVKEGKEFFT